VRATIKLALILFVVCGLAAGALAFVNAATKERIAAFVLEEQLQARKAVFPEAQEFAETEPGIRWEALREGQPVGSVVRVSTQGYSGPIVIMVGIGAGGVLTGARVISQSETPGLGAKILDDAFLGQYQGKAAPAIALRKDDPADGQIDAIAAATISSRAVTRGIRAALDGAAGGN
jgi:electron transport complex protein RnfG